MYSHRPLSRLLPLLLPLLATAQEIAVATSCTTRYGISSMLSSSTEVPTYYRYTTTTSTTTFTSETHATITATTIANITALATVTIEETITSTPDAISIPTSSNFIPLMVVQPTPTLRKRFELGPHMFSKRQTPIGYSSGFRVPRNGSTERLVRNRAYRVDCTVLSTVSEATTVLVDGPPETVFEAATSAVISTVSVTNTVTEVLPAETVLAACGRDNVVNQIRLNDGRTLVFDSVLYFPPEGFPDVNELVLSATSGVECCVACQTEPNCAGSFFVPDDQQCHLRLTQPPAAPPALPAPSTFPSGIGAGDRLAFSSGMALPTGINLTLVRRQYGSNSPPFPLLNATFPSALPVGSGILPSGVALPTASGIFPSGTGLPIASGIFPSGVALPSGTGAPLTTGRPVQNNNGTCARGSLSNYLGTILGQDDFPVEKALSFSNGPCGYLSVWPIPTGDFDFDAFLDLLGSI